MGISFALGNERVPLASAMKPLRKPGAMAANIQSLIKSGRNGEAEELARTLVGAFPQRSEANHLLARALVNQGKKTQARPFAEAALKASPDNPALLLFMGRLFTDLKLHELVLPLLERALMAAPRSVTVNWALADYHLAIGSGHTARGFYETALALEPDDQARNPLCAAYARCLVAIGDVDAAEAVFIELMGEKSYRIWSLTEMALLRKHRTQSEIGDRLRNELARSDLNDERLSLLIFALARLEENSGNHDAAFGLLAKSRGLLRMTFDSGYHSRAIDRTISFYTKELIGSAAPFGSQSALPVFVVGMPRSGTTLTEQIIAAHNHAGGLGELTRMYTLESAFRDPLEGADSAGKIIAAAKRGEFREKAEETLAYMQKLCPEKERIVDKNPLNYLKLGFIHLCFPNAKIIYCKRHPADNFISAFQNQMNRVHDYCYDQRAYAACYLAHERLMAHWKSCFPENIFELQYEALVENFDVKARELIAFIGLPWDENCLNFSENKTTVKTFSSQQVRNKLYNSSVGRWKNYEKHLGPLFEVLNEG